MFTRRLPRKMSAALPQNISLTEIAPSLHWRLTRKRRRADNESHRNVPPGSKSPVGRCRRSNHDLGFNRTSDGSTKKKTNSGGIKLGSPTQSLAANHLPHPF